MLTFLAMAILISLLGVMAPGPITAVAIGKGSQNPHAGAALAVGHGIVEFPLMIVVLFGPSRLLQLPHLRTGISMAGALFLVVMAAGMLRPQSGAPKVLRTSRDPPSSWGPFGYWATLTFLSGGGPLAPA